MNLKRMALIAIGLLLALFAWANYVSALTADTHKYIAQKATIGMELDETNLFKGSSDPDKNENYSTYPEFLPENHYCYNEKECNAIKWAEEYRIKAFGETEKEKKSYYFGVAINFFSDSIARSQRVGNTCYGEFEQQIEQKIKNPTSNWAILYQCPNENETETITLRYSEKDLNSTIAQTKKYISPKDQPIDANRLKPTEKELLSIVKRLVDQNITGEEQIQLSIRLLTEFENFSCLQSSERKNTLYEEWKKMNQMEKACLEYFSALPSTNPSFFPQQCPTMPKDPSAVYLAQQMLDKYYRSGFSDLKTISFQQPTTTIETGGKITSSTTTIAYIEYVPKKIKGCTIEFNQRETAESEARDQGTILGIGATTIAGIFLFIAIAIAQRGE